MVVVALLWARVFPPLLGLIFGASCHNEPCPPIGFDEGERFQITILGSRTDGRPCDDMKDVPRLQPGDAFTLVGGNYVDFPSTGCTRLGRPGPPPFATDVLTSCAQPGRQQLGLQCSGVTAAGCPITAEIGTGPHIDRGIDHIEQGFLGVTWYMDASCNTGGCVDNYDVRIDRLPP
jgi:hypothetical protein